MANPEQEGIKRMVRKILWFPRLQNDIDIFHIRTWIEMIKCITCRGIDVLLVVSGPKDIIHYEVAYTFFKIIPIKILRILTFWINGFFHFQKITGLYKPDVIIMDIDTWFFSFPLLFLAKCRRPGMIIDFRSPNYNVDEFLFSLKDILNRFFTRVCLLYANRFVPGITVITDYFKEFLSKKYKIPVSRIGVWTSGVNIEEFRNRTKQLPVFDSYKNHFILMQHGIIADGYSRGLAEAVEALLMLDDLDVILIHFGSGLFRAKEKLRRLAERLGVSGRLLLLDPVPPAEVPFYLSRCDCGILAYPGTKYWNCNNPIKLLEYLACGKPVIVSSINAFRSVLGDSESAFYIEDNSPGKIAACIRRIYSMKAQLRHFRVKSRDIVARSYTWKIQAEKLIGFINNIGCTRNPVNG